MKKPSFNLLKQVAAGLILSFGAVHTASAGIIIERVTQNNTSGSLVRFNTPQSEPGPSTTITGTIGPVRDRYLIDFTSDEMLYALDSPMPADPVVPPQVRAVDGGINRLGISVQDGAFTRLFVDFRKAVELGNPSRFGEIVVSAFDGEVASFDFDLFNGNNFLEIRATGDTLLKDMWFVTPFNNIVELRPVRFDGLQDAPVPEPATLLSLGIGVAGMLAAGRRKRPAKVAAQHPLRSIPA